MIVGRWQLTEITVVTADGVETVHVPLDNRRGGGYRANFRYADAVRLGIQDGSSVAVLFKGIGKPFTVHAAHNVGGRDELLTAVLLPKVKSPSVAQSDESGTKRNRRSKRVASPKHAGA